MSIETESYRRREYEPKPPISYDQYRSLCDASQSDVYRVTGLTSPEGYEAAKRDALTKYIEIDGYRVPLFASIGHAGGYNEEGCRKLTGSENVYISALPLELLEANDVDISTRLDELGPDASVVIETSSTGASNSKAAISERLSMAGGVWAVSDFIDPRCPEGHQTAQMSVYTAHFRSPDEEGSSVSHQDVSYEELFEEDRRETGDTFTEFIPAAALRENEELFDQLWGLHDDKFNWLGKFHPVSMQENKAFFEQILLDEHTKSFVRFDLDEEGRRVPVSHGCSLDGLPEQLSDQLRQKILRQASENGERVQFFYGIVSKSAPDKMIHYAKDVMSLNSRLLRRSGNKALFVFESTNMSGLYIPRLVEEYIGQEPKGVTMTGAPQSMSTLDYWFLKPASRETV